MFLKLLIRSRHSEPAFQGKFAAVFDVFSGLFVAQRQDVRHGDVDGVETRVKLQ